MNITFNKPIMIFRKDFDNGAVYTTSVSQKNKDGGYDNYYKRVQFKKDVEIENKTLIMPHNCFPSFYKNKDGKDMDNWVITEFEIVGQEPDYKNMSIKTEEIKSDTLDLKISDEDLPF